MHFIEWPVRGRVREMRIVKAHHVVGERNHALPGETDAASGNAAVFGVGHTAIGPVPVRIEDRRERTFSLPQWPIKISRNVKARKRLKIHLFDAVSFAVDLSENARVQRSLLRHRTQAATDEDMLADILCA